MQKALVVSQRGRRLEGLLAGMVGAGLEIATAPALLPALAEARRGRTALLVIDTATLAPDELALLPTLPSHQPRGAVVAIVPADRTDLLRTVLRAGVQGVLLDPFDLAETETILRRLLDGQAAVMREPESIDALAVFLKGIAHEILNPLTSVSGILQLLLHEGGPDDERTGRYRTMFQGVERIQKTLRELEYFVRARKPQRRLLDPARFVRETVDRLRTSEPTLQVACETPDYAPAVLVDPEQLALALRHLICFAAGRERLGPVNLDVKTLADQLEIGVQGTLPLPLPERPERLLVPYQDPDGGGRSGSLELAAAYGILRSHKGALHVEALENGAVRFRACLPIPHHGPTQDPPADGRERRDPA